MTINQYQAQSIPLEARLMKHRRMTDQGCWVWDAATTMHGYGRMSWRGKVHRTHRLAAYLWLGMPLDSRDVVRHSCDNPPCFNPAHLLLGTQAENVGDMMARGRWAGGGKQLSHCQQGHPLEGGNVKQSPSGKRRCRECARLSWREYYERRKAREGSFWQAGRRRALDGEQ